MIPQFIWTERNPPNIPTTSNTAVSNGKLISEAIILGVNKNRTGLICIVLSASICSETRITPISAAMADPALAVTIIAVVQSCIFIFIVDYIITFFLV